jgi:hypothetical protein
MLDSGDGVLGHMVTLVGVAAFVVCGLSATALHMARDNPAPRPAALARGGAIVSQSLTATDLPSVSVLDDAAARAGSSAPPALVLRRRLRYGN